MLKTLLILALIALAVLAVQRWFFSFGAQRPSDYAATTPLFDVTTHLAGSITSEGVIFGPDGRANTRFVARMQGDWDGNNGTLAEDFTYSSGGGQQRVWTITLGENGAFTATAPDIIGTAQGQQSGASLRMTYRIQLPDDAGGYILDVVDWLYLTDDGNILNKSEMRKFGVKVAELVATLRPEAR